MANLTEVVNYDAGVYQLETTDPVQGGPTGIANAQAKNLANRTAWLKKHIDDLEAGNTIPPGIAKVNSQAFTGSPTAPTAAMGDRSLLIANTTFVQDTAHGTVFKSVAGSANVTLTAQEAGCGILVLTGALTGNIDVIVPATSHSFVVANSTTGAFTLRLKTAAGPGTYVKQGSNIELFCDGTGVYKSTNDFTDTVLAGTSTAPSAAIGDNSQQVANTTWVQNTVSGVATVNVAGGANVTLTQAQYGYGIILLTGAITANINVILPTQNDQWIICNKTTGNFTITIKTAAGTGSVVRQGESVVAYCDGTNIALAGATPAATFSVSTFTATAGQTSFAVQYTPGNVIVARNGSILRPTDYTGTSGTAIVLASAALAGDQIDIYAFASLVVANALTLASADSRYVQANNATLTGMATIAKALTTSMFGVKTTMNASSATTSLQLALADTFVVTIAANTQLQFDFSGLNIPANSVFSWTVVTVNDGTANRSMSIPGVKWSGQQVPSRTLTANAMDVYTFFTLDGGTTVIGSLAVADAR